MVQVLTVLLAAVVGGLLGLLGGGGSVLAVPLLVFVAGLSPHEAATMSLFVVAVTSVVGLVPHARAHRVHWRSGAFFGVAGMAGAFLGAILAGFVPGGVLLGVFAVLMLVIAAAMIRGRQFAPTGERASARVFARTLLLGFSVGGLTGFVGAGGGFVIVPALVLLSGMPMVEAIGTSLLVVAMQASSGLIGHLANTPIDWRLALGVATSSVLGAIVGSRLTGRINQALLRSGFGWFVLMMGFLVIASQLPAPFAAWGSLLVLIGFALGAAAMAVRHLVRRQSTRSLSPVSSRSSGVLLPGPVPRAEARAPTR